MDFNTQVPRKEKRPWSAPEPEKPINYSIVEKNTMRGVVPMDKITGREGKAYVEFRFRKREKKDTMVCCSHISYRYQNLNPNWAFLDKHVPAAHFGKMSGRKDLFQPSLADLVQCLMYILITF